MDKIKALDIIAEQLHDNLVKCVYDIALICKHAQYPEDLEDIYDVLTKYGINYGEMADDE